MPATTLTTSLKVATTCALAAMTLAGCGSGEPKSKNRTPSTTAGPSHAEWVDRTQIQGPPDAPTLPDQSPPVGINGFVIAAGRAYLADLNGDQILAVNIDTGEITNRWPASCGPDDVDIDSEGNLWLTCFTSGELKSISVDGSLSTFASLQPGLNPIAVDRDDNIFVGAAISSDGLWKVTKGESEPEQLSDALGNVNSFDISTDDKLYGPSTSASALVEIDLDSGEVTPVAEVESAFLSAVEVRDEIAYLLSSSPPMLYAVNLEDPLAGAGEVAALPLIPDNVDLYDGQIFISSFQSPELLLVHNSDDIERLLIGSFTEQGSTQSDPSSAITEATSADDLPSLAGEDDTVDPTVDDGSRVPTDSSVSGGTTAAPGSAPTIDASVGASSTSRPPVAD